MLLSRIGENAKFLINGDTTQCDLPRSKESGLWDAAMRLKHVSGIALVEFDEDDIVRSGLCKEIVLAYQN
jgi:phosphate starvation-inducible PhoH-like protein